MNPFTNLRTPYNGVGRRPLPVLWLLLTVAWVTLGGSGVAPAAGQAPEGASRDDAPPCPATCPPAMGCRVCRLKLDLYRTWMEEVGRGATMHALPGPVLARLAPFFPDLPLEGIRVGFSPRQLADGITDCMDIYLALPEVVEALLRGQPLPGPELELFIHEVVHAEQCHGLGGREAYALHWFRDLGLGALLLLLSGDGWRGLHGAMPMEAEAAARARDVTARLLGDAADLGPEGGW